MTCGIYEIKCKANGRLYIGSSKNIEQRWREHIRCLNNGSHTNDRFLNHWRKYGVKQFDFLVIEECEEAKLIEREQHRLDAAAMPLLNLSRTAHIPEMNARTRAKVSTTRKQLHLDRPEIGANHSRVMKDLYSAGEIKRSPHSEETKQKLSKAAKAVWASGKTKARNMSKSERTNASERMILMNKQPWSEKRRKVHGEKVRRTCAKKRENSL